MKTPTQWRPTSSGTTTTDNSGVIRTTQDGNTRITQANDTRILNESIVSGLFPTSWLTPVISAPLQDQQDQYIFDSGGNYIFADIRQAKFTTPWRPSNSGTITTGNTDVQRTTQAGDSRVTQDSNNRVLNESIVSGKPITEWTEN